MWRPSIERFATENRYRITVLFFLLLIYFLLFNWFAVPPVGYSLGWQPETTLRVMPVVEEPYQQILQPDDIVTAIDGIPVQRGKLTFPFPRKSSYTLTLLRAGISLDQQINTPSQPSIFIWWQVAMTLIAITFWGFGCLCVWYVRETELAPLYAGFCFQFMGCVVISGAAAQYGAPGGWIVGDVLLFAFPFVIISLAYLPIIQPISKRVRQTLLAFLIYTVALVTLSAFEVLFLFPDTTLGALIGITSTTILVITTGISLIWAVIVLLFRVWRAPAQSYQRQQLQILWVCLLLAITPLLLGVILPFGQENFAPYPLISAFLLFIPAGYFFILHRRGLLTLDVIFGRFVVITIVILVLCVAYLATVSVYELMQPSGTSTFTDRSFFLFYGAFGVALYRPVQTFIDSLIYGNERLNKTVLDTFIQKLAHDPSQETISFITNQIAERLNCEYAIIVIEESENVHSIVRNNDEADFQVTKWQGNDFPHWTELIVPIKIEQDRIGLILLSQPINGYFHARHRTRLDYVANLLAPFISLLLLSNKKDEITERIRIERQLERKKVSTFLHSSSIQDLIGVLYLLKSSEQSADAMEEVKRIIHDLRDMSAKLQPASLEKSFRWMLIETVRFFQEKQPDCAFTLNLNITDSSQPPELVVLTVHTILTESLTNITKHAHADQVTISVFYDAQKLLLTIQDNGVGLKNEPQSLNTMISSDHIGLVDMVSSAKSVGGKLEISNVAPSGCRVNFTLNLSRFTTVSA